MQLDTWTCNCGQQKYNSHCLCKHLVQAVGEPDLHFFQQVIRWRVHPFYKHPQLVPKGEPHRSFSTAEDGSFTDGDDQDWLGDHSQLTGGAWREFSSGLKCCRSSAFSSTPTTRSPSPQSSRPIPPINNVDYGSENEHEALDVIPEHRELAGRILDEAYEEVEEELIETLNKQNVTMTDGWKDISCNSIAGVNVSASFQPYLIELRKTNKDKKDAVSFCEAYEDMIDCTEVKYKCNVIAFTTDNDGGGGGAGHKLLVKKRPWLLGTPCTAHQCQLVLGDYFKENKEAAAHDIFDQTQLEKSPELSEPLAYIMANLTCWTTHFCSFDRLRDLKDPLQHAAFLKRRDIIAAQVGAEKNNRKKQEMEDSVNKQCDLIMDNTFWNGLGSVVEDIEPICYAVNICQTKDGMKKQLEKRWKSYDQEFFMFAMVLNPFEWLDQFREAAKIGIWTLLEYFKKFYQHVNSCPPHSSLTDEQLAEFNLAKEKSEVDVAKAFMQYMSWTGDFHDFKANKDTVQKTFVHSSIS
ncbi:hypothetical protein D9758_016608 [Tetrapyrgos nigripes]|uniref:DUF659 domain-containing protein n=1 Tax=Tetrapyrgos nigripes TaxID=182062 RepID=A0A8H5FL74_9AGAR|nr:hypothetical protein D9758_016608 [Tetrapyrgos nigripes]